jgi:predicted O-methyltransferase YrrM
MASTTLNLDQQTYDYFQTVAYDEPKILAELRAETASLAGHALMQITPEQGAFMALMVRLTGAKRVIECGTFTGYSALAMALALPPGGRIIACDVSEEWTAIARRFWTRADVADRIELRLAPAAKTLGELLASAGAETFDMMFIDADKPSYDTYYESGLKLLRAGGLMLIDNVLWGGDVARPEKTDADTVALRALNSKVRKDKRVDFAMLPIGDGVTMVRKR